MCVPGASVLPPGTEPAARHAAPCPGATAGRHHAVPVTLGHRTQRLPPLQLVHMFASLLERPLIKAEVSPYYSVLLGMFKAELENVKVLFDTQTASPGGGPALHRNTPPVAGQLKWAKELQQRLEETHGDLFAIDHPYAWVAPGKGQDLVVPCGCSCSSSCLNSVMSSAEAQQVSGKYEEMMGLLQGYCEKVYEEWASGAGRDCHFTLEQPLICRDPDSSLLSVNFSREVGAGGAAGLAWGCQRSPACCESCFVRGCGETFWVLPTSLVSDHCVLQLVAVLREVKYLNFQQQKDIPDSAENLFAQHDTLQKFVDNLDLIVGWYNEVGCKGETTWGLFHALAACPWEEAPVKQLPEAGLGHSSMSPTPRHRAVPGLS